ncbi:MAG: lipid-A-disaccharide synthase [Chromatiales bacterium]|jgi:lipid-A-disaccharide synthase|nr:lipid-A-disaccharide synthase [Chromatiales bacterium]
MTLRVGLVAGEASGDQLGAGLITAIRQRCPEAEFYGVGGPGMTAAGFHAWYDAEQLSVIGLSEIVRHLPELIRIRRDLRRRFLHRRPDVVVGIDSPDFNLGLERRLRRQGIKTVHYVSPSVWAWRAGRVRTVRRSANRVLCLLPFEPQIYQSSGVDAVFVGHPLADRIEPISDKRPVREALGLAADATVVAVLPGSRGSELAHLGADFAAAIGWLAKRRPDLVFVAPMASPTLRDSFDGLLRTHAPDADIRLTDGQSRSVMAAADVILMASGTATLEACLIGRPMVVAYRVAPLTRWILQDLGMLKIDRFALPNLLSDRQLVPEILQDDVSPEALGSAVLGWLDDADRRSRLMQDFRGIRDLLRQDADQGAAEAVLSVCNGSPGVAG